MTRRDFRRTHLAGRKLHPSTQMTNYGYDPSLSEGSVKPPIYLTSTFVFESAEQGADFFDVVAGRKPPPEGMGAGGLVYSRFNNPNSEIVEDRLAFCDGAEAGLVTASGMAAISAVALTYLRPGDTLVHYSPLYGGTATLFEDVMAQWQVNSVSFTDGLREAGLREALEQGAKAGPVRMIYLETPANPTNAMIDLAMIRRVVDDWTGDGKRPVIVCDNTMLGPVFQKPLEHGVDICVYSLTKYVGGHSDLVAGGITGSKEMLRPVRLTRSTYGLQLDPHSAWMIGRSLETLSLRMERAEQSARKVAEWLAGNDMIPCRLMHPLHDPDPAAQEVFARQCTGAGSTFSFVVADDRALAFRILNGLRIFKLAVSLGGSESLVCHPASTTHSGVSEAARKLSGVNEGLIRVSVGLEDPDDLILDLEQAFRAAAG